MAYLRVIPRDLFNDASLLKCLGQLYLALETINTSNISLECEEDDFGIDQCPDSGHTFAANVALWVKGNVYLPYRPLNSRAPWPLYLENDGEEIAIFTDDGRLSDGMLAFMHA